MANWWPPSASSARSSPPRWCRPTIHRCPACSAICCSSPPLRWPWCATRPGSGSAGPRRSPAPSGCCWRSPRGRDSDNWAPALFVPAAAALNLALLPGAALDHPIGRRLAWVPCAALGATGLLLAELDQGWAARIGVLLFVPLTIWQARARGSPAAAALPRGAAVPAAAGGVVGRDPRLARHRHPARRMDARRGAGTAGHRRASSPAASPPAACGSSAARSIRCPGRAWRRRCRCSTLAVCYARVAEFHPRAGWAVFAMLLAAGLTGAAAAALREQHGTAARRAGIHAAGAVAALALGCAMLLRDHWLTLAVSLFLPALAWVAAQVDAAGTAPGGARGCRASCWPGCC